MDIKTLALIFAIVAVAIAGFLLFQTQVLLTEVSTAVSAIPEPGATSTAAGSQSDLVLSQLPETVDGFERSEFLPRVEPVLVGDGELYSSWARFEPLEGSGFEDAIDVLTAMFYRFDTPENVMTGLSIFSVGSQLGSFSFQGKEILWYHNEVTAQSNYFIVVGADLIQVLAVAGDKDDPNLDAMESAALNLLAALFEANQ